MLNKLVEYTTSLHWANRNLPKKITLPVFQALPGCKQSGGCHRLEIGCNFFPLTDLKTGGLAYVCSERFPDKSIEAENFKGKGRFAGRTKD